MGFPPLTCFSPSPLPKNCHKGASPLPMHIFLSSYLNETSASLEALQNLVYKPIPIAWSKRVEYYATTFKSIKLALCLLSEPQIFVACISQQGQSINGEFLPVLHCQAQFFMTSSFFANWSHVFGKTSLRSKACNWAKFGPILMITDWVLSTYAAERL